MNRLIQTVFLLNLTALVAFGQITGEVRGLVLDGSGAAMSGAKVRVVNSATGETRSLSTDAEGRFIAPLLSIGDYDVKAEAGGFRVMSTRATVKTGEIASILFKMEVGQVTESVTVSGAVSRLDTENAQIQTAIVGEKIQEIPVNRNPNLFALTAPGIAPVSANNPFLGSGSFNSNGGRGRGNNITVDGISATDVSVTGTGGPLGPLNFSSIAEVKVITNNFSAEYGRNSSAQMIYITKSGTNSLHGELYEYLENDKLNARPFFDRTGKTNIVRENTYGYSLGGPLYIPKLVDARNKVFWFTDYEGFKLRGAGAARIAQVPTAAQLALVTDPTSKALLDQYKLPAAESTAGGIGTVQQQAGTLTNSYQLAVRGDWNISDRDKLWVRYSRFNQSSASSGLTFIGTNLANFGAVSTNSPRQATLAHTHTIGTSAVNEFRFGFGRSLPNFTIDSTVPLGPRIGFNDGSIASFGVWEGLPQGREQNTYQFTDNFSFTKGRHNLKTGFEYFHLAADSVFDALQRPLFAFNNWNDFATGQPFQVQQRFGSSVRTNRVKNQFAFLQDDWKVSRNLTLNLGIRLEVAGGVTESNGLLSNLNLDARESLGAAGTGAFGSLQVVKESFKRNWNWAPRFGFAYNVGSSGKTVIRGGYGMAYDFLFLNPITNQRFLPPFIITGTLAGTGSFTGNNTYSRFVAGSAQLQTDTKAQVGKLSTTALNFGSVSPAIDSNLDNPQVQQFSLGIQHDVLGIVWKAGYVGTKGNFLPRTRALNLIAAPPARATSVEDETARLAQFTASIAGATGAAARFSNRIDGRYNDIGYVESSANSIFHSMQFEAQKRFGKGFLMNVAYTISKSIDDNSDVLGVLINDTPQQQNPRDNRDNRAVSQFDLPQRLAITHSWQLPWGKGIRNPVARHLVHGWGFSGITSFRAGFPVTFTAGARRGVNGLSMFQPGNVVRPNVRGAFTFDPIPAGRSGAYSAPTTGQAQNISAYADSLGLSQPLLGNIGSLGRGTHRLNGESNFDWNIFKDFSFFETVKVQFRTEMYNVFNNTSFQEVNANISNPAFGQYNVIGQNARTMQMGLRLVF